MVGTTDRTGARWLVRRLDPSVRPSEGAGASDGGPGLAPGANGTAVGLWADNWSVLHPSAASTFPAPLVDSLRVASLVGDPTVALGADGRGVVAFSRGPLARAAVRASLISLP